MASNSSSDKGLVVGRVQFEEDGGYIDCTKMGVGGKAIPPYIDKIENIVSDAEFILLVEKEAAYMRLAVSFVSSYYICGDFFGLSKRFRIDINVLILFEI